MFGEREIYISLFFYLFIWQLENNCYIAPNYKKHTIMNIDYFEYQRLKQDLRWWKLYGQYVSRVHSTVDGEARGYAEGEEKYIENFKQIQL